MDTFKILIVDDEPHNLEHLRGILKDEYRLSFAKNGKDALRRLQEQQPDLILLDVVMPEMDGFATCKAIKANPVSAHIPIIFLTALSSEFDEEQGLKAGGVDYIIKPIKPIVVRSRIKTHLLLSERKKSLERAVRERTEELHDTRLQIIQRLGRAAEYKDNETGLHVVRMSHYSQLIAHKLGWPDSDCDLILNAAPMHDIGKIGIPDHILRKPGKLDDDEWAVMRRHPRIGAEIIGDSEVPLLQMARDIALTHHEKWDGSGYPEGLRGEEIPLAGRIIALADVFDALTTERPYKKAWPVDEAVAFLDAQAGKHFDPQLVELFHTILPDILEIKQTWEETA